jgi:hypothetical protein
MLKIIDLIDEVNCFTFVPSKAKKQLLRDIIKRITTLYHPERIG